MPDQKDAVKETPKLRLPDELLNPAAQAATNAALAAAVKEAVAAALAAVAPILQSVALTPERLDKIVHPGPSPEAAAREKRERELQREDEAEIRRNRDTLQASCPHRYPSGAWSVQLVHNFLDRQPRGICMTCQLFLQPKRWEIGPPDAQNKHGRPFIAPESSQYYIVRELAAQQGG